MGRLALEVADIFRVHGPAWRKQRAGYLSLGQLKAMSAIEQCRTAALGGHALRCDACDHEEISYNSCRNRPDYSCWTAYGVCLGIDDRRGDGFGDTHARCQRASRSSSSQISLRRMNQGFQGGSNRAHTGSPCHRNSA